MGAGITKRKSNEKKKKNLDGKKQTQDAKMNQSAEVQNVKPIKDKKQKNKEAEPVITRQIIVERALIQISSTDIQNQIIVSEGQKFAVDNIVNEGQKFRIKNIQEEGVNQSISYSDVSVKAEDEIQQFEDQFIDYIFESHFDVAQNFKLNK